MGKTMVRYLRGSKQRFKDNKKMPVQITAIELENFQSIEQRTRIDFKPITMLFGPNSAGKSSVFDALELLRALLDPTKFDEKYATSLVTRWARHQGTGSRRKTFVAVEFPLRVGDPYDVWNEEENWSGVTPRAGIPNFHLESGEVSTHYELDGATVRIELLVKVVDEKESSICRLSEFRLLIKDSPILTLSETHPDFGADAAETEAADRLFWWRWLTLHDTFEIAYFSTTEVRAQPSSEMRDLVIGKDASGSYVRAKVESISLSPLKLVPEAIFEIEFQEVSRQALRCASDLIFYFGTLLWAPTRSQPGIVMSDRRAPEPDEALALVDFKLGGWWARNSFSPSSPASLLMSDSSLPDEHFRGLAEAAYAELLLRTASADFWGDGHAAKHVEPVRDRARILERVNHHLDKSLFKEKLYKLACAATLMVPIDLDEDDPWSYYALAQPAVVRLFLQDGAGQKVELQDVGSGIPFVLPVLYAASSQGFVKVQQPELHLHPALQSSIADVFIEELNREGAGQFLIETHSEHLLLRLLRRIRDQEKGRCLSPEMRLTHKDVAVYYFDPQVSGGTVVTQQLVTPLGDFFTDWPRGFFAERDGDLFDA
jgi:predicted ATPase